MADVGMTAPTDDEPTDDDEDAYPRIVRVPTAFDPFGNPTAYIETDPEAAGGRPLLARSPLSWTPSAIAL
jgi:hypothetical protein